MRSRAGYGVRTDGVYAVFGVGAADPRGGDAEVGAGERAQFAVLDLRTGVVTAHPSVDVGRVADAAAPVVGADDVHWVVRLEAGARPGEECPNSPDYCWTWTLHATRLPEATSTRIAAASRPGPQFFLPAVATDLRTVVWLDASASPDGTAAALMAWQPGSDRPRVVVRDLPFGRLSVDGGAAWIGTGALGGHRLLKVDLTSGRTVATVLPDGADQPTVLRNRVAYIRRPAGGGTSDALTTVLVAPVDAAGGPARPVISDHDVYTLNWGSDESVIVSSNKGYTVTDGRLTRQLRLDLLSGVHNDAGWLAFVQERQGRQVVVVSGGP